MASGTSILHDAVLTVVVDGNSLMIYLASLGSVTHDVAPESRFHSSFSSRQKSSSLSRVLETANMFISPSVKRSKISL